MSFAVSFENIGPLPDEMPEGLTGSVSGDEAHADEVIKAAYAAARDLVSGGAIGEIAERTKVQISFAGHREPGSDGTVTVSVTNAGGLPGDQ